MNELELMNAHCDALYVHNEHSEIISINDWLRRPAPVFWLGITPRGMTWRFREDVSAETRARVEALVEHEPGHSATGLPHHHDSYRMLMGAQEEVAGPTYWLPAPAFGLDRRVVRISKANAGILRHGDLDAWIPDVPHQQPMFASLDGHRAVAVCASVRSTSIAHGAGVETLAAYRRQGHGTAAVAAWSEELLRSNIVPLYSTSWDNAASQGIARRLGFEVFGWEYRIDRADE